jgi:hypothetical protein
MCLRIVKCALVFLFCVLHLWATVAQKPSNHCQQGKRLLVKIFKYINYNCACISRTLDSAFRPSFKEPQRRNDIFDINIF